MHRSKAQQEYKIRTVRGNRSPVILTSKYQPDSNGDEDTESDEGSIIQPFSPKTLRQGRVEDYAVTNKSKNIKLPPKSNRISSFIIKDEEPDTRYQTVPSKSIKRSNMQSPSVQVPSSKYSIKNPFKKSEPYTEDLVPDVIYVKKPLNTSYLPTNSYYDMVSPTWMATSPQVESPQKYITEEINNGDEMDPYEREEKEFLDQNVTMIQSNFRGYLARKTLYQNLNYFYNLHTAADMLNAVLDKRDERLFWNKFKKYVFNKKQLYIKNNIELKLNNIPAMYRRNIVLTKLGLGIVKRELSESFQFIVKKKKDPSDKSKAEYTTEYEEVVDYKMKLKNKILRQLLIMKMRKEEREIGNAFKTFWRNGLEKELNNEKKELIKDKKTLTKEKLKHIIKNKINKRDKLLRKNFAKFYYLGVMREMTMTEEQRREIAQQRKLHKIVKAKDATKGKLLKSGFIKFYYCGIFKELKCVTKESQQQKKEIQKLKSQTSIKPEETVEIKTKKTITIDPIVLRERKLRHFVLDKFKQKKKFFHDQFVKFYYRGLYRHMVHGPQPQPPQEQKKKLEIEIPIDESIKAYPKTVTNVKAAKEEEEKKKREQEAIARRQKAKELRRIIGRKGKNSKEKLKFYFNKFYLNGIIKDLKQAGRNSPKKHQEISLGSEEIISTPHQSVRAAREEKRLKEEAEKKAKEEEELKKKAIREDKLRKFFYKKERNELLLKKNIFSKWNLIAKILRIQGSGSMKKKKIIKKKKKKVNAPQSDNQKENIAPMSFEPTTVTMDIAPEETKSAVLKSKRKPQKPRKVGAVPERQPEPVITNQPEEEDDDSEYEIDYEDAEDIRDVIAKHCKLDKIFHNTNSKNLLPYFNKWKEPQKGRNIQLESFKANLFSKLITNVVNAIATRQLSETFSQWKKSQPTGIKRNIRATFGATMLSRIIKKINNRKHFANFVYKYMSLVKRNSLRKAVNNWLMRSKRFENKALRRRLYRLLGRRPHVNATQALVSLSNSLNEFESTLTNVQAKRMERTFMKKLMRKSIWETPIGIGAKLRKITFYLKNGQVVTMEKDQKILRNYFWRWGKPMKYNFRKYFAIALKLKEKELEKASRKWQYSELDKKDNNNSK